MKIIANCPLCQENSLHIIGGGNMQTQQCISCGYVTSDRFKGTKEDNEMYKTLPEEMQSWSKESNDHVWIPSMITLPFGTIYPIDVQGEMKWSLALMIDIPEEKQKDFPIPNQEGKFYKQKYDIDNQEIFDEFIFAMSKLNELAKEKGVEDNRVKLPKLKKIDG